MYEDLYSQDRLEKDNLQDTVFLVILSSWVGFTVLRKRTHFSNHKGLQYYLVSKNIFYLLVSIQLF